MKVLNFPFPTPRHPAIDLHTLNETLSYMHDDLARVPAMKNAADALQNAINEISLLQHKAQVRHQPSDNANMPLTAVFLPRQTR